MKTELNKIVQNSEENQVFLYEACLYKKKSLKLLCWVKTEPPIDYNVLRL